MANVLFIVDGQNTSINYLANYKQSQQILTVLCLAHGKSAYPKFKMDSKCLAVS